MDYILIRILYIYWYVLYIYTLIRIISSFFIIVYLLVHTVSFFSLYLDHFRFWEVIFSVDQIGAGIMMGPALGAPLQAINLQIYGFGIDGNNSPGIVLLVVPRWLLLFECRANLPWKCGSRTKVCISNLLVTSRFFNVKGRGADCWLCLKVIFQSFNLCIAFWDSIYVGRSYSIYSPRSSGTFEDVAKPNMRGLIEPWMGKKLLSVEMVGMLWGWSVCLQAQRYQRSAFPEWSPLLSWSSSSSCRLYFLLYQYRFRHDGDMIWYDLSMMEKMMSLMIYVSCNFMYVSYVYVICT